MDHPHSPPRRSSRLLRFGGILAALLLIAGAVSWIQGRGGGPLNPIAKAAAATENSSGAKFSFRATVSSASLPQPLTTVGQGAFNGQTNRSQMTLHVATPKGTIAMEALGSGTNAYYKSKSLQAELPDGDEWLGIDLGLGSVPSSSVNANPDPSALLDLLRAVSDELETLGEKAIDGAETKGYRGTFDPDRYINYLRDKVSAEAAKQYEELSETAPSTIELETWIDDGNLVRRMGMTVHTRSPESEQTTVKMSANFHDFGIAPEIQLPDPDSIYDATPKVRAELGLDDPS
jgi:hypothetical protein